jgi:hypothetical protein
MIQDNVSTSISFKSSGSLEEYHDEFAKRNARVVAVSVG